MKKGILLMLMLEKTSQQFSVRVGDTVIDEDKEDVREFKNVSVVEIEVTTERLPQIRRLRCG